MREETLIETEESRSDSGPMEVDEEMFTRDMYSCEILGRENMHHSPLQQLETYLDQFANRSFRRSRGTLLLLSNIVITRRFLARLLPLLPTVHDEVSSLLRTRDDDDMDSSPCNTNNNTPVKFVDVRIENSCRFFSPTDAIMTGHVEDICTHEDKVSFIAALARVTEALTIQEDCPEIVSGLLNIPGIDHLEPKVLNICGHTPLWDMEYARLGALIEKSVQLTSVSLILAFVGAPREFYDSLAKAIHIQALSLDVHFRLRMSNDMREAILSNLGVGVVEPLLRNPKNRLIQLDLDVDDHHLLALAQLLPASRVQSIDFSRSRIQAHGLLEFFRQLPRMRSLHAISLGSNPWEKSSVKVREECGAALLHGLIENPSVQYLDNVDNFPQCPHVWHYITLNRAGRKVLTSSFSQQQPIPDGLWPQMLARAGNNINDRGICIIPIQDKDKENYVYNGPANAVYFFLQNSARLCSYL